MPGRLESLGRSTAQIFRIIPLEQLDAYKNATKAAGPRVSISTVSHPNKPALQESGHKTELGPDSVQVRVRFPSMMHRNNFEDAVVREKKAAKQKA